MLQLWRASCIEIVLSVLSMTPPIRPYPLVFSSSITSRISSKSGDLTTPLLSTTGIAIKPYFLKVQFFPGHHRRERRWCLLFIISETLVFSSARTKLLSDMTSCREFTPTVHHVAWVNRLEFIHHREVSSASRLVIFYADLYSPASSAPALYSLCLVKISVFAHPWESYLKSCQRYYW